MQAARASDRRSGAAWAGAASLVGLLLVSLWTIWDLAPPQPLEADAAADQFSAERAITHIEAIAQEPRPMGTPEHARARSYLTEELEALGAHVEIHEAVGLSPPSIGMQSTGLVRNIVATFPGSDPTGTILLTAHYDSVPTSPGANDDAAGVAVALEAARALTTGTPLRNDIVVLITDGEEMGLLGAEAFTNSHPLAEQGGVVLNHEARGAGGTAIMFRTTSPDLVRTLSRAAPAPAADSAVADAFEILPNDTDYVAFTDAGFMGLDFAYAGHSAIYHSALDTPDSVSASSVQHMGANTLAVAAELGPPTSVRSRRASHSPTSTSHLVCCSPHRTSHCRAWHCSPWP